MHPFEHTQFFAASDVARVPKVVGIYAWYGLLDAGRKDWEYENIDGQDAGQKRLLTALQRHSTRYASPPLKVTARSRLEVGWDGELDSTAGANLVSILDTVRNDEDQGGLAAIKATLGSPSLRAAMMSALNAATPVLSSPLYIGISNNLHDRLNKHVAQIRRYLHAIRRNPEAQARLLEEGSNFAHRAVGSGFAIESLQVWILNLESLLEEPIAENDMRVVAEATEWFLNRWHRPPHGKR